MSVHKKSIQISKYVLLSYWSIDWIEFYALKCREKRKFETCLFFSFDFETFLEFNFLFFFYSIDLTG